MRDFVAKFWFWDGRNYLLTAGLSAGGSLFAFPPWLAWAAIAIDYLELPVIYDTLKTFLHRSSVRSCNLIRLRSDSAETYRVANCGC